MLVREVIGIKSSVVESRIHLCVCVFHYEIYKVKDVRTFSIEFVSVLMTRSTFIFCGGMADCRSYMSDFDRREIRS